MFLELSRRGFAACRLHCIAAAALLAFSCRPVGPPLEVEYAGCYAVQLPGPVCTLAEDRRLRFWLRTPPGARLTIAAGGLKLSGPGIPAADGERFELRVPAGVGRITVRANGSQGRSVWSLELAEQPEWRAEVERSRVAGDLEAARQLLKSKIADGTAGERALALRMLARHRYRDGDRESGADLLRQAIAAHRGTGSLLHEVEDATVLMHEAIVGRRFSEVRSMLDAIELPAGAPAEAEYLEAFFRGLLAARAGDARTALGELQTATRQAERIGAVSDWRYFGQVLGWQLQALGRTREATELFGRLRQGEQHERPCDRALLLTNHAWALILSHEAGEMADDPTPLLMQALEIDEQQTCPPTRRANILINLALAHLHHYRLPQARAAMAQARELEQDPRPLVRLWWLDVEGRIALRDGQPTAALELYERLSLLAQSAFSPESRWRAAFGKARALEAEGRRPAALRSLEEAESLLEAQSLQVPMHEGRETFIARRESGTRLYLELLLASGRLAETLEVVRRSRSRMLRGLRRGDRLASLDPEGQERWQRALSEYQLLRTQLAEDAANDWRLSADQLSRKQSERADREQELRRLLDQTFADLEVEKPAPSPTPRPGELVLAYHPLPTGWVALAADADTVVSSRFELPSDALAAEELAARVLVPFIPQIQQAQRLRILPYGPLREVDFHALPFDGDVLLAAAPVVYGLDLRTSPAPQRRQELRALLVANPQFDLPAAQREADAVARMLQESAVAWDVALLRGRAADVASVVRGLWDVDLFHYAGHGVFGGRGGWQSALRLAGKGRLTPGDVLALERSPTWVVLSGCDTARSAAIAPLESIGLAQAFLAAGSHQVLAAVRPIDDRAAAKHLISLYRSWHASPDFATRLREVQLAWRRQDPGADWANFRVLEP